MVSKVVWVSGRHVCVCAVDACSIHRYQCYIQSTCRGICLNGKGRLSNSTAVRLCKLSLGAERLEAQPRSSTPQSSQASDVLQTVSVACIPCYKVHSLFAALGRCGDSVLWGPYARRPRAQNITATWRFDLVDLRVQKLQTRILRHGYLGLSLPRIRLCVSLCCLSPYSHPGVDRRCSSTEPPHIH